MQITTTFKKLDTSNALQSYIQKRMSKLDRMLDGPAEVHVVLSVEKIRHIAEATFTCNKLSLHAKEASENMYSSIDTLVDKIKLQITKNKEKARRHMSGNKQSIKTNFAEFNPLFSRSDNAMPDEIDV